MSLVLTTTTLWISEIKQLLTSPIAQQKIHGLKRIEITCKKSFDDMYVERSNILINQGIIEMLCEIALSSEIRVVLLTLQCLQVLSVREAFFLGNRWEIVVATLRKLSCSLVNDETEAAKKIFLNACSITYKISNKLGDVSSVWPDLIQVFKNVVEKLRIESVYYIADAIGRFVHENAETQLDLETLELALKIFRCVIEHFKSQSIENELQNSEDGIWENEMISMGEMGIVFMKRCICPRSQYPSSQESTLNYEFLLAFEHVFLPVLLKCKFERSMKLVKEDLLTICLKSADSLFYHPSMEFKVDCSEKIFPVLYDAFPIIESSSSKHCKSLARKLLADVLSGLCFKDFSSFNADLTFEYWYSYFKEGLERLKFNISCVPRFIKNNTWGAWSMVIMHYFCIRSNSSNVVSSDELFDAISRQVLLISRKGKHLDLVSAKVIWLVFADCARRIVIHSKRVLQNICSRQPHQRATIHMLVAVCENELSSIQSLAMIHPLNELVLRKFFLRVPALMQLEVNRDEYWKLLNKLIMISRRFLLHYHLMTSSSLRALATLASTSECTDETQFWNKWILSVPEENEMSLTKTSLVQISKMLKTDLGPALKLRSFAPKKRLRRVTFSEEVKLIPY